MTLLRGKSYMTNLKILMMTDMPWDKNLGGPRAQMALADEFRKKGHIVEKFDYYDAFPQAKMTPRYKQNQAELSANIKHPYYRFKALYRTLIQPNFSKKAKEFVRVNANRFDIIDARESNLPFTKRELKFNGLLVARSVGLYAHHCQFFELERIKWPSANKGNVVARHLRSWRQKKLEPDYSRSLEICDLINVPNKDEFAYVNNVLGLGDKCVVLPYGLTCKQQKNFAPCAQSLVERFSKKTVVFVGRWGASKGAMDWAKIINKVRTKVPEVQFLFLGTSHDHERVLADLNIQNNAWLKIIPHYDNEYLPKLLNSAAVGAFPSYIEGFPYAVLEKLACGIPTI